MKIGSHTVDLRKVHFLASNSDETYCFDAEVHLDGRKIGTVRNDGRGGCHCYHPADCQRDLRPLSAEAGIEQDFEPEDTLVNKLFWEWHEGRYLTRRFKTHMVYQDGDALYESRTASRSAPVQGHFDRLRQLYPNAVILNTLPLSDAVAIWIANQKQV